MEALTAESGIRSLRGIGDVRARALVRIGLLTLGDLCRHYPRAYQNRGDIKTLATAPAGERAAYLLTVASEPRSSRIRAGMTITKFRVFDDTGSAEAVFFNQPYVRDIFHVGSVFRFWGEVSTKGKQRQIAASQYELYSEDHPLPDFIPVYSITEGVSQKVMASLVGQALTAVLPTLADPIPESILLENSLPSLRFATEHLHQPTDSDSLSRSLRRIVFDELFCLGLGIALSRSGNREVKAPACAPYKLTPLLSSLPYELTGAQKRTVNEIYADMTGSGKAKDGHCPAMRRILIGDVGCGKTVCAAAAIFIAAASGYQSALMVPTSILAEQHYRELAPLFSRAGFEVALLTGSTKAKERREILARLANPDNPLPLVIGTHALLSEEVAFARLALTVTDEQHRFGMLQRARLQEKSDGSHMLVMSATPIPRTLAHVLYGDLALSKIDEMPRGRQRVDTYVVGESYRDRLNAFIRRQVSEGGQVYIVCPAIEEKPDDPEAESALTIEELTFRRTAPDTPPLKNASEYAAALQKSLPELSVALLHGRMKAAEKDAVMASFVRGETDVLVSTTVIEVGVNVPRATLMIVENAERFGLSQLHQLRGRVGRGERKSFCILVSDSHGEAARSRLETMRTTYDGYTIAERDLSLRGPGDFFQGAGGEARQAGSLSLRLASCCDDAALMERAFSAAASLIASDPTLSAPDHALLRDAVARIFTLNENTIS